jgi:hypothetical protein
MSKSLIYLAGPYLNCTHNEAMGWRLSATKLLGEHNVVCPLFRPEELTTTDQRAMVEQDLYDLGRCKAVLANLWKPSAGSSMGLWEAHRERKLTAVVAPKPAGAWVKYTADYLTDSVSDACLWLATQLRLDSPILLKT